MHSLDVVEVPEEEAKPVSEAVHGHEEYHAPSDVLNLPVGRDRFGPHRLRRLETSWNA